MFSALNIVQIQLSDVPGGRDESWERAVWSTFLFLGYERLNSSKDYWKTFSACPPAIQLLQPTETARFIVVLLQIGSFLSPLVLTYTWVPDWKLHYPKQTIQPILDRLQLFQLEWTSISSLIYGLKNCVLLKRLAEKKEKEGRKESSKTGCIT
jgi:hypothetical protein